MEIDLDNLVFNGLDEAEERNAERLDVWTMQTKKRRRWLPMMTAATPARSDCKAPVKPVLFFDVTSSARQWLPEHRPHPDDRPAPRRYQSPRSPHRPL